MTSRTLALRSAVAILATVIWYPAQAQSTIIDLSGPQSPSLITVGPDGLPLGAVILNMNRDVTTQAGSFNHADVVSESGGMGGNSVALVQLGDGNQAKATQMGTGNGLVQVQVGSGNAETAHQIGNGNILRQQQFGNNLVGLTVTQSGGARATVTQSR
jgi:hypothetical protein